MFEKEAEEYAIGHEYEYDDIGVAREALYQAYLVGAEFGYNKANEELEKENEGLKAFDSHYDEIEEDAKAIVKENTELKEKLDKIRKYLVYDIFDRFKYLENLLKISQEKQEELSKCIIEQQKTTGSLTDIIYELKAQIGKM